MKRQVLVSLATILAGVSPVLASGPTTLPAAIYAQMKNGSKLDRVWMSPKFDAGTGFTIGKVDSQAEGYFANVVDYVPYALGRLVIPGSTNVLNLTVTELTVIDRGSIGLFGATIGVEGEIVDKDGGLLFAFTTRQEITDRETVVKSCQGAIDRIVWSLAKDLGKPLQHALEVQRELQTGQHNPSGLVPAPPVNPQKPQTIGDRLMLLEDLKQKGLITPEEYKSHNEEILKGL